MSKLDKQVKDLVLELTRDWYQYEDEMSQIYEHSGSWAGFCGHEKVQAKLDKITVLISTVVAKATDRVTRFEVIDHTEPMLDERGDLLPGKGRALVKHGVKVRLSFQDDDRTLKVFVTDKTAEVESDG